jgi:hypothetical protein
MNEPTEQTTAQRPNRWAIVQLGSGPRGVARRAALEQLSRQVVPADQRGQRAATFSPMFQILADAYVQHPRKAAALLRQIMDLGAE